MSRRNRPKANVVVVDHRNIVGIDIGKRKHAATAITPKVGGKRDIVMR